MISQKLFNKLVNVASRVHQTDQGRTNIIADLFDISELEYQQLSKCVVVPAESAEMLLHLVSSEIALVKAGYDERCWINENRGGIPNPEPPTEELNRLENLKQLLNQ